VLTIFDDVTKERLVSVPDTSLSGTRVVREMTTLSAHRGRPGAIVSDNATDVLNGPGLHPGSRARWALNRAGQAQTERLRRRFQGRMREECLNEHLFVSINHARAIVATWVDDFNTARPHSRSAT
jgi:transposase InsO family protein